MCIALKRGYKGYKGNKALIISCMLKERIEKERKEKKSNFEKKNAAY